MDLQIKALVVVLSLSCLLAQTYAAIGMACTDESQCDKGECCQILSEFMVVSKRVVDRLTSDTTRTGTCQRYKTYGESCGNFDKLNGYCGCGLGLECHTYQVPLSTTTSSLPVSTMAPNHLLPAFRKMLPPQPGYTWVSKCDAILT